MAITLPMAKSEMILTAQFKQFYVSCRNNYKENTLKVVYKQREHFAKKIEHSSQEPDPPAPFKGHYKVLGCIW